MRRLGITAKLVLSSAAIVIGFGLVVTAYSVSQLRRLLYQEMIRRVEAQTQNWVEANVLPITFSVKPETLPHLLGELKKRAGISYVILLDADGKPRAATRVWNDLTIVRPAIEEERAGM